MIKKLDHLELEVPSDIYLDSENLLQITSFKRKKSNVKHLHVFELISPETKVEVEVLMTPTFVKSFTCDCNEEKKNGLCKHIGATLLYIRSQRVTKKQKNKPKAKIAKAFTSSEILKQISPEELKAFIRYYAVRDKKFELALKVNFARRVQLESDSLKYQQLFDKILPRLGSKNYTIPRISAYLKHAREIYEQYKDARTLETYDEAVTIMILLFRKTAFALFHSAQHDKLDEFYSELHKEVSRLYRDNIAPELRDKLFDELLEIISLSFYMVSLNEDLIYPLSKFEDKNRKELLLKVLLNKLDNAFDEDQIAILASYIISLSTELKHNHDSLIHSLTSKNLPSIFHYLFLNQNIKVIQQFIKSLQSQPKFNSFNFKDIEITLARKKGDNEMISQKLMEKLMIKFDKINFQEFVRIESKNHTKHLNKLIRVYKEKVQGGYSRFVFPILEMYNNLGEYALLTEYILETNSYDLMTAYINRIEEKNSALLEYYFRKYTTKCEMNFEHAHRNQIYLRQNFYAINNAAVSSVYLNKLDVFKEEIEELEDLMEE